MDEIAKKMLELVKIIQYDTAINFIPPSDGTIPKTQKLIPHSLVKNTKNYIEKIVYQINGCYENGWYDACAVMMRRCLETLIIETFEYHNLAYKIKNSKGDFYYLKDLILAILSEKSWNLSRNSKSSLTKLKEIGDRSAHSRRFVAFREDIDKIQSDFRIVIQELLYLADLKR